MDFDDMERRSENKIHAAISVLPRIMWSCLGTLGLRKGNGTGKSKDNTF